MTSHSALSQVRCNLNFGLTVKLTLVELGKIAMAAKELYTIATCFIRLSLILFYYRLIVDTGLKYFKWVLHWSLAFNIAILIAFTGLSIGQCTYVELWMPIRIGSDLL
jgi:hypothetical protein